MNWIASSAHRNATVSKPRHLALEPLENRSLMAALASGFDQRLDYHALASSANASQAQASALVDDAYEQNDTRSTARNLGTVTSPRTISGLVMADYNDWYRFSTTARGTSSDFVAINLQNAQGDLDLELYNVYGQRIGYAGTTSNTERISLANLAAGTYYARVYGYRGATNPSYSLTISPRVPLVDDALESNDTLATARDLGALVNVQTTSNLVMADSHDWYRFSMAGPGAAGDRVAIDFQHWQGNLGVELYDAGGTRLGVANGTTGHEEISLAGRSAGTYYVHVYSAAGVTNPNYSLTVDPGVFVLTPPPAPEPEPTTSLFDVQLVFSGLTAGQQAIFEQAAAKWESIIVGDLPNVTYNGSVIDDVRIYASATPIDGQGNILGQAGPEYVRSGSYLPYLGSMEFDTADMAWMESNGSLYGVILHEMAHVLGVGTLWSYKGLVTGAGTSTPRFTGAQATAEYNALFGVSQTGVPLENGGGAGTRDSHWSESLFSHEIMTGYIGPGVVLPISRMTVASLADLGYSVNMAAADAYTPPGVTAAISKGSTSGGSATSLRQAALPALASTYRRSQAEHSHSHVDRPAWHLDELAAPRSHREWEAAVDSALADWLNA